jgi:hypothetical protein
MEGSAPGATDFRSMLRPTGFILFVAIIITPFAWPQAAPKGEKLPTAQEVENRFVAALGGKEAILRPRSMTMKGEITIPGKDVRIEEVIYVAPFKRLEKVTVTGRGEILRGYDGKVAWQMRPGSEPQIFDGDYVLSIRRDADLYYGSHVLDYFRSMETVDVEVFEGRPCYHLKGINNWGKQNDHFYDRTTGLLAGYQFYSWDDSGTSSSGSLSTDVFSDYQNFGGLLIPTRVTSKERAQVVEVNHFTSITFDDADGSVFALPEAVKARMNGAKPPATPKE